ncbi:MULTISPECIES: ABC transporter permease [Vibrio]|uniref:Transport permease protein n=1 Tax=Vibrio algicola TaxID=2662262 RepID=A0A5Q0TH91_9VIBR|nr:MULTISPECIES: ABC transporter permease [Vibrio]MBD1577538.1 ABC transporter permease [Vibrio sp. S11_S32]
MMFLSRIQAIFFKELLQLKRDKMTFRMIILIPIIQLLLFGYAINTNVRHIPVGVVDLSQTTLSRVLVQTVEATQTVSFTKQYTDLNQAQKDVASAKIRAVLYIPPDLSQRLVRNNAIGQSTPPATSGETSRPIAQWIIDGSDTIIASTIKSLRSMPLTELLDKPANQVTPTFAATILYNPEQRTAVNIIPGLVAVILTMTMIMFTSAAIVRERERGNMEMLITTPVRSIELMIGKVIPYLFIGLIQTSIILALGYFLFNISVQGGLVSLGIATLLFILASLALGLVLSTIATNQLQAMQMTVFILLPSILLSGFMFPYDGMPVVAQYISEILPATHFMRLIRGVILRDAAIADMSYDALWLLGFSVVGMIIASLRFKKHLD